MSTYPIPPQKSLLEEIVIDIHSSFYEVVVCLHMYGIYNFRYSKRKLIMLPV